MVVLVRCISALEQLQECGIVWWVFGTGTKFILIGMVCLLVGSKPQEH